MEQSQRLRLLLGLCLATAVALIAWDYATHRRLEAAFTSLIHWIAVHPWGGVLVVILVYILATILFIPGALLTMGSGFAFRSATQNTLHGVVLASIAVFVGAFLGSLASFLLGRYLFRDSVTQLASQYPLLRAIDRALEHNGFQIMLLLRLSPLIPFNALDYISGVTSISLHDYALALVGILPGTIMFCLVGATASSLTEATSGSTHQNEVAGKIALVGGLVFAVLGVTVASYYSKLELEKIVHGSESGGISPSAAAASYMHVEPVEDELQNMNVNLQHGETTTAVQRDGSSYNKSSITGEYT